MDDTSPNTHRRSSRATPRPWWRTPAVRVTVAAALVVVLVLGLDMAASAGRIHRGVRVNGVPVGGMTRQKAAAALESALPQLIAKPVTLVAGEASRTITAQQIGASFDYAALSDRAFARGRSGNPLANLATRLGGWIRAIDLQAAPRADRLLLHALISELAKGVEVTPRDASVVLKGTEPSVSPAEPGRVVAREKTGTAVLNAFVSAKRTVTVSMVTEQAAVSDEAARAALSQVRTMLSGPVAITFDARSWEFSAAEIAKWISFRIADTEESSAAAGAGAGAGLEAFIDPEKASGPVIARIGVTGRAAKDASFEISNGQVSIVPSQDGVGPDIEALALELTQVLKDAERVRSVDLRTHRVPATITTAKARTMGIKERISRYTTTYDAGNRPRVNNIHLLADALDGTLVAPGATFSFNDTIGPRTAAKGYQEAPAIVNGKLVPQLGGGICQVGTTIFNTVFESGLPVVSRQNHSFYISHYPKGRDATVSWGGPDFKFKNDTESWVLIAAAYTNWSLTIALYGTDPGYEVRSETGQWVNEKPYATEEVKDPTMPKGARVVEDGGVTGRTITVVRYVTKDGEEVRTDTFLSVYKPKTEVVRVGTKPVSSTGTSGTVSPRD